MVLGPEFSREEVKGELLSFGALIGSAVSSGVGLAQEVIGKSRGKPIVRVSPATERGFYAALSRRLDVSEQRTGRILRSVRTARQWAAHPDEELALLARLEEVSMPSRKRAEIFQVREAWTQWLEATDQFDDARVFEAASHALLENPRLAPPVRVDHWSFGPGDPREEFFWATLASRTEVQRGLPEVEAPAQGEVVLFGDDPATRREVTRRWKGLLLESRDPTRVRMREILKSLPYVPRERRPQVLRELIGATREDLELVVHAWVTFEETLELAGEGNGDRSLWSAHLKSLAPPPSALIPREGVRLVRYGQAILRPCEKLWVYPEAQEPVFRGDDWISGPEAERLAEFGVLSTRELRKRRLAVTEWVKARAVQVEEIGVDSLHSNRFGRSSVPARPIEVSLPALPLARVRASDLDATSRCGFLGLIRARWRIEDRPHSLLDTLPTEKGIALHEAARALASEIQEGQSPNLEPWLARAKPWERERWRAVLQLFVEKERDYQARYSARVKDSEIPLEFQMGDITLYGRADRIDETPQGELLVIDYKTGASNPHGQDVVEQGYALQLGFYAVAARRHFSKEVAAAQFIELNATGGRARGIFPKSRVGSKPPGIAPIRSNSKSLIPGEPSEVWERIESHLGNTVTVLKEGHFRAVPKNEADCERCSAAISCNAPRRKSA